MLRRVGAMPHEQPTGPPLPHAIPEATRPAADETRFPDGRARDAFVGRREEMAHLEAALADACAGRGRLVLLGGDAGIGKTRTADELAIRAREQNVAVLTGRCYEGEGAPAYWPWVQVIRAYAAGRDAAGLRAEMGAGAADIARIVPEVGGQLAGHPRLPELPPEQARFRLFDSITTFFKKAARHQPLVLVLDDLHRADQPSLFLLQFLTREMGEAPLLVVGSYRDVEVNGAHPLAAVLADLCRERAYAHISLHGLLDEDVRALVTSQGGENLPGDVLRAILQHSEGNPFFVKELLRHLIEEGLVYREGDRWQSRLSGESLGIPEGVRRVIGRRLSHLSAAARRALASASIFGREFHFDVLQRLTDASEDQLLVLLEEALRAQLVEEYRDPSGPAYRFGHALVQETLYDELSIARRQRLHLRAGRALEEAWAGRLEPHLTELAHHFAQGNDPGKAIDYSRQAGEAAWRIHASEQAMHHWRIALALLEAHGGLPEEQADALQRLGELSYSASGDTEKAIAFHQRALSIYERLGARAKVGATHMHLASNMVTVYGGLDLRKGRAHLEAMRAILGEDEQALPETIHTYSSLSIFLCVWTLDREQALIHARRALARGERDNAWDRIGLALHFEAWFLALGGELGGARALFERVWKIGEEKLPPLAFVAAGWCSNLELFFRRDPGGAKAWAQRELHRLGLGVVPLVRADLLERLRQAHVLAGEMEQARQIGDPRDDLWFLFNDLHIADREWARAEEMLLRRLEEGRRTDNNYYTWAASVGLGALYLRRGQYALAEDALRRCVDIEDRQQVPAQGGMSARVMLAQLLARTERLEEARRHVDFCLGVLAQGEDWGGSAGRVELAHGAVLAAEGEWGESEAVLEQALAVARRYGVPWDEADALQEQAHLLLARDEHGDRCDAVRLLDATIAIYERLGARQHRDLVVAEKLRAQGIEPPPTADAGAAPAPPAESQAAERAAPVTDNLFRQEGEYWTIAYDGTTFRLKDSKGLQYVAHLLRHPGQEFHVANLVQRGRRGDGVGVPPQAMPDAEGDAHRAANLEGHAGDVLDARARAEYKQRLADLRAELEDATGSGDSGRAARARQEIELISHELVAAYGLGGRARKVADPVERLRKAVTNRIKESVARIREHHVPLGLHLANAIRTGIFCSYAADRPITWNL